MRAIAEANLTGYKQPKVVEFRTELPKTPVGKILRRELRDKNKRQPEQPQYRAAQAALFRVIHPMTTAIAAQWPKSNPAWWAASGAQRGHAMRAQDFGFGHCTGQPVVLALFGHWQGGGDRPPPRVLIEALPPGARSFTGVARAGWAKACAVGDVVVAHDYGGTTWMCHPCSSAGWCHELPRRAPGLR